MQVSNNNRATYFEQQSSGLSYHLLMETWGSTESSVYQGYEKDCLEAGRTVAGVPENSGASGMERSAMKGTYQVNFFKVSNTALGYGAPNL